PGNLHDALMARLGRPEGAFPPPPPPLYAASYRPVAREGAPLIDLWRNALEVGQPLPAMPLPLRGVVTIDLDLEESYMQAAEESNL
ncbi:MAG: DUF4058 domain-containing protein, partial [Gemmataceae bacterium]|nr:DUF4058 domain-containing protein [Gemmataceae bacterium]